MSTPASPRLPEIASSPRPNATPRPKPLARSHTRAVNNCRLERQLEPLRVQAHSWGWHPQEHVFSLADCFDGEYRTACATAREQIVHLSWNGARDSRRFNQALQKLRGIRYSVQPLRLGEVPQRAILANGLLSPRSIQVNSDMELAHDRGGPWLPAEMVVEMGDTTRRRRQRWKLDTSIWAPRRSSSNSGDYYETAASLRRTLEADWSIAKSAHGLRGFIERVQAEAEASAGLSVEPRLVAEEVEEAREVVWDNILLVYGSFDYYCALYSGSVDASGEWDIHTMPFNGWLAFAREAKFVSRSLTPGLLELTFTLVNVDDGATRARIGAAGVAADGHNKKLRLNRHEFVEAIVRIAIVRYVQSGEMDDVSDAIERCCREIATNLPREIEQSSNEFRSRWCYVEATDAVLRKHAVTLRNIYDTYSELHHDMQRRQLTHRRLLSCGEWLAFVGHMGFLRTGNLNILEAKLIFTWSRIRSVSDYSDHSQTRLRNLTFEDFLEAIVRLSLMVALPTDAEVAAVGAEDAGSYLLQLRSRKEELFEFIQTRKRPWHREPTQHASRCVDHLLSLVARIIKLNTSGTKGRAGGPVITKEEAQAFASRSATKASSSLHLSVEAQHDAGTFTTALGAVAARLLQALAQVPTFGGLSQEQLVLVRDSMSEAPFEAGAYVINQGDLGDCFFIILDGEAEAVLEKEEDEDADEEILKRFGQYDVFGERALLKKEPRFASIRARTGLNTLTLTQATFERVMGQPLSELLPDYYS
jgi:hypothetical protein